MEQSHQAMTILSLQINDICDYKSNELLLEASEVNYEYDDNR